MRKKKGTQLAVPDPSAPIGVLTCSGIVNVARKALAGFNHPWRLFVTKAPCLHNLEEPYFRHHFERMQKYSTNMVLAIGNCSPFVSVYAKKYRAYRLSGDNCFEFVLGRSRFSKIKRNNVLCFLPDQVRDHKKFYQEYGFERL